MFCFSRLMSVVFPLLFIILSSFNVVADTVSFEFTATLTQVHQDLTSMTGLVGQSGTGRVTYDLEPGVTSYATDTKMYGYDSPPAHFEFTISGHTYIAGVEPSTLVTALDSAVMVEVGNDRPTWPGVPVSDRIRYWGFKTGQTIDGHAMKMELILNDQTSSLLDVPYLPDQCPNLADFDGYPNTQFVIMIDLSDTTSTSGMQFSVDAITPISNPEPHRLSISLPERATEGDDLLVAQGRVDVSPAPTEDLRVTLISGDVSELTVPPYVMVPANTTTASFDLGVIEDSDVDGTQTVEVTASNDIYGTSIQSIAIVDNDESGGDDNGGGDNNGDTDPPPPVDLDLSGVWNVTEIADETNCGEGINTKQYTVTLTQNGTAVEAQTPYGTFDGRINGLVVTWSGMGSEDGGTLDTHINATMTFNAEGTSFTGTETWRWSDGSFECSGTSELSGNLNGSGNVGPAGGGDGGGGGGGCFISILH